MLSSSSQIESGPFVHIFARVRGPPTIGFEHFGVRAHSEGEIWTLLLSGRVANARAAMGSRWRFVLYNSLSLCGMPRLKLVADECWAHVVLWPGARIRSRENRGYHTEQLRGGYWALHFEWKRGPCTNSSAGCTMIFSRRTKRKHLHRIVRAPAVIAGRGEW